MAFHPTTIDLVAPCGLDCFNCEMYERNISQPLIDAVSARLKRDPETVPCRGCRPNEGHCLFVGECPTYACVKEKGIRFCFECGGFPGFRLAPAKEGADKFPHNFKVFNLCRMKAVGVEQWAEDESQTIRRLYFKGKFVPGIGPVHDTTCT
ncbi:MAG: DUF3795 domain-containing protein [Bacteroidota bacterium]|nr:DUF3795 domain-containing protein [Bacteroidota bacterium]